MADTNYPSDNLPPEGGAVSGFFGGAAKGALYGTLLVGGVVGLAIFGIGAAFGGAGLFLAEVSTVVGLLSGLTLGAGGGSLGGAIAGIFTGHADAKNREAAEANQQRTLASAIESQRAQMASQQQMAQALQQQMAQGQPAYAQTAAVQVPTTTVTQPITASPVLLHDQNVAENIAAPAATKLPGNGHVDQLNAERAAMALAEPQRA